MGTPPPLLPPMTTALLATAAIGLATLVLYRFWRDVSAIRSPHPYVVLATGREVIETRPLSDCIMHAVVFKCVRPALGDGALFQILLARLNAKFRSWDVPFEQQGKDAATEVHAFCRHWGVPLEPWVWSKPAKDYRTANEFFSRAFAAEHGPEANLGPSPVVAPSTSVVSWYTSARRLPNVLKNDAWTLEAVGLPDHGDYLNQHVLNLQYRLVQPAALDTSCVVTLCT